MSEPTNPIPKEPELSLAQRYAFQLFKIGKNVLVSGPAGTGKSFLISICKAEAEATGRPFQITATTGAAAVLLGSDAKTIHSWSGLKLGLEPAEKIIGDIVKFKTRVRNVLRGAGILVIDEISMMSMSFFDLLDEVLRGVRMDSRPFGGIQVILCGDFFQLPPVSRTEATMFCFESKVFKEMFNATRNNCVLLTDIFRQKDKLFSEILNEIREGKLSEKGDAALRTRLNAVDSDPDAIVRPTRIFPRLEAVDECNAMELGKLTTPVELFKMKEHFESSMREVCRAAGVKEADVNYEFSNLRRNLLCDDEIKLKVGAQVMNIRNTILPDDTLLNNGAQGVVIAFNADAEDRVVPVVRFQCGVTMQVPPKFFESSVIKNMGLVQIPLRLAWAVTIHKAQGATLDKAEMDLGSSLFAAGQTYSAVSRLRTLDGLFLTAYDPTKIVAHEHVKAFYKTISPITEEMLLSDSEVERLAAAHIASVCPSRGLLMENGPAVDLFSTDAAPRSFMVRDRLDRAAATVQKRKCADLFSDDVDAADEEKKEEDPNTKIVSFAGAQKSPFEKYKYTRNT